MYRIEKDIKHKYFSTIRLIEPLQIVGMKLTENAIKKLHDGECKFECGTDVAFKSYFKICSVSPTYLNHLSFCLSCVLIADAYPGTFWSIRLYFAIFWLESL